MEVDSPKGKIMLAYGLLSGEIEQSESLVRAIQRCALCGICENDCPSMVRIVDIIKAARNDLKILLPEHEKLINEIKSTRFEVPETKRLFFIPVEAKVMESEIEEIAKLLDAAPFYANCGDAIERIGRKNDVAEMLVQKMKKAGVEEIIFYAPDCMKYFEDEFDVKSIFDFLDIFSFKAEDKYIIHKPAGISDENYEKIKRHLSSLDIVEPEKEKCCGCREEFRRAFPEEAGRMAKDIADDASLHERIVLTISPSCYQHLSRHTRTVDMQILLRCQA